jgi:CofH subfamily radical SAM domain protein
MDPRVILSTTLEREEITPIEALILMQEGNGILPEIFHVANELNSRVHRGVVTYVKSREIHYTNICRAECSFCSFWRRKGQRGAYALTVDRVVREVRSLNGVTEIRLQGGLNPELPLAYYCDLLRAIKAERPRVHLHAFSPAEVFYVSKRWRVPVAAILAQLQEAGLDSMPGNGAEILNDKLRKKICPDKLRTGDWVDIVKTAHRLGIRTSATVLFGHIEDEIYLCEHLEILRNIQKETGGFTEFVPTPYIPEGSPLSRVNGHHKMASEDQILKVIAISRIFLNRTIPNIQANWMQLGVQNALRTLTVGANDIGGLEYDEDVIKHTSVNGKRSLSPEAARTAIRRAGLTPRERDTMYNVVR